MSACWESIHQVDMSRNAVRSSNGSYEFIDFRETAPAAAFQDMYNENANLSLYGGLAR